MNSYWPNAARLPEAPNSFTAQTHIDAYFLENRPEYIKVVIQQHKWELFQNLADGLLDDQHYTIRFRTHRQEAGMYGIIVTTILEIGVIQYRDMVMPRFTEVYQAPPKKNWWQKTIEKVRKYFSRPKLS